MKRCAAVRDLHVCAELGNSAQFLKVYTVNTKKNRRSHWYGTALSASIPIDRWHNGSTVSRKCFYSFYRATAKHTHGLAIDICLSVRLSVRLSDKRVHYDKTKAPSENSSIMTNRKSPTSFPMSLRWTSYVAPDPKRGPQKRKYDQ